MSNQHINQASEDELATNIDEIIEHWDFSPFQNEDSRIERLHKEIESIIRNEKLKLLAEVRERVQVNQKGQFEQDGTGTVCWYLDDLVEALKELEAEL